MCYTPLEGAPILILVSRVRKLRHRVRKWQELGGPCTVKGLSVLPKAWDGLSGGKVGPRIAAEERPRGALVPWRTGEGGSGGRELKKRHLQWVRCSVRREFPNGLVAEGTERKGAKKKCLEDDPQVGSMDGGQSG